VINPGDIVVGDEDGIVSFPLADAARVLDAATSSSRKEAAIRAEIATGSARQSWLDAMLDAHGIGEERSR
jgi:regulator of RNase E activity RraA